MRIASGAWALGPLVIGAAAACSSDTRNGVTPEPCARAGIGQASRFAGGSADGHANPAGAKAAKEARAGRIKDASLIRQPANARNKVRVGDFLLANEKIAVYIEDAGESDGYNTFGGEILAIEPVGDDGLPMGISQYGETLVALSRQTVATESVTVMNDGSDGKAAIVRASGALANIPFMETFRAFFPKEYGYPAAIDYVLEPGAEKVTLRLSLMNTADEPADFSHQQMIGFFQYARSHMFTPAKGFDQPLGDTPFVAYDGGAYGFVWRMPGTTMAFGLEVSGFQYYQADKLALDACGTTTVDYVEIIPGGPGLDGAFAAMRRVDGDKNTREVVGTVVDESGAAIAGASIAVLGDGDAYVTGAVADENGRFVVHPPGKDLRVVANKTGYTPAAPLPLLAADTSVKVTFAGHGTIVVHATDATSLQKLPVRIQVIPAVAPAVPPASLGIETEANGRLHQEFAVTGYASLVAPAGQHRVVVSRGYEWEIFDQVVTVEAGKTVAIDATLERTVDSAGVMCGDFHIHSHYSADSSDTVLHKVKGAIADGLEVPVSSEHEWVIDFQPLIKELGLEEWAFGFPSEELTTFTWGHFGVIPLTPRPDAVNNGAVTWIGKKAPEVFKSVRALPEKPFFVVNHPSGGGFGAYFSSAGFDRATGTGTDGMWSDDFDAIEVFNASDFEKNRDGSVGDWFALLEKGKTFWAVGSSDSHHLRTSPVGYPRTCMLFGHDDPRMLSAEGVKTVLGKGQATISGGLYMTVLGPGGAGPGATLPPSSTPPSFKVVVQAPSWLDAKELEVIVDGQTISKVPLTASGPGPGKRYEVDVIATPREARARHWVVFHAKAPDGKDLSPLSPGKRPFAVSNPIFF